MSLELVRRAVDDERMLRRLKIPDAFWPLIGASFVRKPLYSREGANVFLPHAII